MRRSFIMVSILFLLSSMSWSQTAPASKAAPAKKPAAAAKPATAASAEPTAVIDTSAGKLTCKLFPDKAPIGVANFIGLADGTKDWTSPTSHAKKHGVSLYEGTIFGQCDDATVALVKEIARMGRDANDRPYRPVKINHITIVRGGAAAAKPAPAAKPVAKKPAAPAPKSANPQ